MVASFLTDENKAVRPLLDQMYDSARGVQPISVAITPGFVAGGRTHGTARAELGTCTAEPNPVHLGRGARLRTLPAPHARFIRKHAPAHPGPPGRWYDRIPILLRLRAAEDRLRGFPWGESSLGDRKLARRYDHEI